MPIGINMEMRDELFSVAIECDVCGKPIRELGAGQAVCKNADGFQNVKLVHGGCYSPLADEFTFVLDVFFRDLARVKP